MKKIDIRIIESSEEGCALCQVPFMEGDIVHEQDGFQFCSDDCQSDYLILQQQPSAA